MKTIHQFILTTEVTMLNILMIGDIVGRPGRRVIREKLKTYRHKYKLDYVIANGENAAGGVGLTESIAEELFNSGVDFITMGNHTWDKKEIYQYIEHEPNLIRPANYPPGTPGNGSAIVRIKGRTKIGIINLAGRVFMQSLDCPFRTADELVNSMRQETQLIIVDMHAEATSEKIALGWYLDGRVSAVVGTHTHVQTADERILPAGTAYITDLGMTGPRDSILGVKKELVIKKFISQMPVRFEVADGGVAQFNGVLLEIDETEGKAHNITRISEIIRD